jgi:hypothetical protein
MEPTNVRCHRTVPILTCWLQDELTGKDKSQQVKANAILKLTYLQMLGYDMSWASFHIVEVMSSPGFAQKRIGAATLREVSCIPGSHGRFSIR